MLKSEPAVTDYYDEMFAEHEQTARKVRPHYRSFYEVLKKLSPESLRVRNKLAQRLLLRQGVTFNRNQEESRALHVNEHSLHLDLIPRIISEREWEYLEKGVIQRVQALNCFLEDIYSQQRVVRDKVISREQVYTSKAFCFQMLGIQVPRGIHTILAGLDLVRDEHGRYLVLEDNLRVPSGISYALKNRSMMKRFLPEAFACYHVSPLDTFLNELCEVFSFYSPRNDVEPTIVLLTPGVYNPAFYEHAFLARNLGIQLVEGQDLVVIDQKVYMRTTRGLQQVDVIYRRIDDDFLDPLAFRSDSLIGVSGLFDAFRAGQVAVVNPWGNGIADDKRIYAFVPVFIRYYLGEEPVLDSVETYLPERPADFDHIRSHLDQMVVKPANASGGYGIFFGFQAGQKDKQEMLEKVAAHPHDYIAQPFLTLSRHPAFQNESRSLSSHTVDFRPFIAMGERPVVMQGGLTRVALAENSLVVNSSQGGGTKDSWVLRKEAQ